MSDDNKEANLARIRENQRRSRARKKEYVAELEEKYRLCTATGIAASAEVQAAARKVVAENRILRHLLRERGLSDAEIDRILANAELPPSSAYLESIIERRIPVAGASSSPGSVPLMLGGGTSGDIIRSAPPMQQPLLFSTDVTDTLQPIFQQNTLFGQSGGSPFGYLDTSHFTPLSMPEPSFSASTQMHPSIEALFTDSMMVMGESSSSVAATYGGQGRSTVTSADVFDAISKCAGNDWEI